MRRTQIQPSNGRTYNASCPDLRARHPIPAPTHPAARGPDFLARFPAEMLALQRLNHPNVVRFYG